MKLSSFFLLFLLAWSSAFGTSKSPCEQALLGGRFLHKKFPELYRSAPVERARLRSAQFRQINLSQPEQKIVAWLEDLEKKAKASPPFRAEIKNILLNAWVITASEISESYYQAALRRPREEGWGDISLSPGIRNDLATRAIQSQRNSLALWIDALLSPESSSAPAWVRYWVLMNVRKMAPYDPETGRFHKRSHGQALPFPELHLETLTQVMNLVVQKVEHPDRSPSEDPEIRKLLENPSFESLYAVVWAKNMEQMRDLRNTLGIWVMYTQGSSPFPLMRSLQGMNTGWCTTAPHTASDHLRNGDFYVFYSVDKNGIPRIPRLAVRMEHFEISEIRGIGANQNFDAEIVKNPMVWRELVQNYGTDATVYLKKRSDMLRVTEIEKKDRRGEELSVEDLRFLYEIDKPVQGFSYKKDPRLQEIYSRRQVKEDLARAFHNRFPPSAFSTTPEEALRGGIFYHFGDLILTDLTEAKDLSFPSIVSGYLDLAHLKSAQNLTFPPVVGDNVYLNRLTHAENVKLPVRVGGRLNLESLSSAQNLILPDHVYGDLDLSSLTSAQGITFGSFVAGTLNLRKLAYTEGLSIPSTVERGIIVNQLKWPADALLRIQSKK